jgi:hypothetical protein
VREFTISMNDSIGNIEMALKKSPNSLTINIISGMIKAHGLFLLNEWCSAYKKFNILKTNTQFKIAIRKDAEKYIFEYPNLVGVDCK